MIGQNAAERFALSRLGQIFDRASRKLSESRIGRRENRERAGARKCIDQACRLHSSDKRREVGVSNRCVDDFATLLTEIHTAVVRRDTTVKLLGADPRTMKLSILYVWVKGKGGWQLVGRQATRL